MTQNFPTIEPWHPDEGVYRLKDANGRNLATLETNLDGKLTVRGYAHTLLIKPIAANTAVITFEP